jgi:hypothetical protein
MFARTDVYSTLPVPGTTYPRVLLNNTTSVAMTNSDQLALGTYVIKSGQLFSLSAGATNQTITTVNTTLTKAFNINYTIVRNNSVRTGVLSVASDTLGTPSVVDDYTENSSTGITLSVTQVGNVVTVAYSSTAGNAGSLTYSINHLA